MIGRMPEPYEEMLLQPVKSVVIEWLSNQGDPVHKKNVFLQDWSERHGICLTKQDYRAVEKGTTLFGKKPN